MARDCARKILIIVLFLLWIIGAQAQVQAPPARMEEAAIIIALKQNNASAVFVELMEDLVIAVVEISVRRLKYFHPDPVKEPQLLQFYVHYFQLWHFSISYPACKSS